MYWCHSFCLQVGQRLLAFWQPPPGDTTGVAGGFYPVTVRRILKTGKVVVRFDDDDRNDDVSYPPNLLFLEAETYALPYEIFRG